jgi:hypothetical protein
MLANPAHSVTVLVNPGRQPSEWPRRLTMHRREQFLLLAAGLKELQVKPFVIGKIDPQLTEFNAAVQIACDGLPTWSDKALVSTIIAPQTGVLCFGGCWLEEDVLLLAIEAVTLGYDVRIFADISLARHQANRQVAFGRAAQHGILVVTVRQMLLEWASACGDLLIKHSIHRLVS